MNNEQIVKLAASIGVAGIPGLIDNLAVLSLIVKVREQDLSAARESLALASAALAYLQGAAQAAPAPPSA